MQIIGLDSVAMLLKAEHYLFKLIANEQGVVLFPPTTEHRDGGQQGIRYADNYLGNALAAMVKVRRIEFRFHRDFDDGRVRRIAESMLRQPELAFAQTFDILYQNRLLLAGINTNESQE